MKRNDIKKLVLTALFTALCFVGTTVIKIPSPTGGYIHPGDGFVLLSGLVLDPGAGALAAGLGSALSDILSGYIIYAPATFVIKALCAVVCALAAKRLLSGKKTASVIAGGVIGELVMVLGYFLFEAFYSWALAGLTADSFFAGVFYGLSGVPVNVLQGVTGVVLAVLLNPVLQKAEKYFLKNA